MRPKIRHIRAFLISVAGGTGKPYLLNTILDWVHEEEKYYNEP
jgi:hypothetical protein